MFHYFKHIHIFYRCGFSFNGCISEKNCILMSVTLHHFRNDKIIILNMN